MKELPLNSFWKSLGADFKPENGHNLTLKFSGTQAEWDAAQHHVGLIDQSYLGKIKVTGADRISFLHQILTNDIKALKPGEGCRSELLHATGKVLMDMEVFIFDDYLLLLVETSFEKKTLRLLDKYLITEDVAFEDVTDAFALIRLVGPQTNDMLKAIDIVSKSMSAYAHKTSKINGIEFEYIKNNFGILESCLLCVKSEVAEDFVNEVLKAGKSFEILPVGCETFEILRIEEGVLRYGKDITEDIFLPETGLEKLVASQTKGCYPGQEVVAKIETYGRLNRHISAFTFEAGATLPQPRDKVYSGNKEIGWITSACQSIKWDKGFALGYLRRGYYEKTIYCDIQSLNFSSKAKSMLLFS